LFPKLYAALIFCLAHTLIFYWSSWIS